MKKSELLQGVCYDVSIDNFIATTTITQEYYNASNEMSEIVYTFPLSINANIKKIEVSIDNKRLKLSLQKPLNAKLDYDEAIEDNDCAFLIEEHLNNIYTLSIANILPNGKLSLFITYNELLEWKDNASKFYIPTAIHPKYYRFQKLIFDDIDAPLATIFTKNLFDLTLKIKGALSDIEVSSPSHSINGTSPKMKKELMDKDIVFVFEKDNTFTKNISKTSSKSITFVIDCSSDMIGRPMKQAKEILTKALALLCPNDTFTIVKYGKSCEYLFEKELLATQKNITKAQNSIKSLDATMGNDSLEDIIQNIYNNQARDSVIVLISNGIACKDDKIVEKAKISKIPHFIIGVGFSPYTIFFNNMAKSSNGLFESVYFGEKTDRCLNNIFMALSLGSKGKKSVAVSQRFGEGKSYFLKKKIKNSEKLSNDRETEKILNMMMSNISPVR